MAPPPLQQFFKPGVDRIGVKNLLRPRVQDIFNHALVWEDFRGLESDMRDKPEEKHLNELLKFILDRSSDEDFVGRFRQVLATFPDLTGISLPPDTPGKTITCTYRTLNLPNTFC